MKCQCCNGSGKMTTTDKNGNKVTIKCLCCDGTGQEKSSNKKDDKSMDDFIMM